jgi:hypothetical protein
LQDPVAATAEVEAAAREGFRCVMVRPCPYAGLTLDRPELEPFIAACAHHEIVVGIHPFPFPDVEWTQAILDGAPGGQVRMADLASLPLDSMLTMAYLMFGGVCDRHPSLRFSFLESNGTWAAFWTERMNSRFLRADREHIKTLPSEILARQCFMSVEGDERSLPPLVDVIGEDVLIWASDFPHFDGHFPGAVDEALEGLASVGRTVVGKVLGENAARMYGIPLRSVVS